MPELTIELLTGFMLVELLCIVLLCIVILGTRKRLTSLEKLMKIALGEVEIKINMGEHIKEKRDQILEKAVE